MRLIDADALDAKVEEIKWLQTSLAAALVFDAVMAIADGLPTIDAEPVRHGRWIETNKPGWVNGQFYETPRLVCPFCTREAAHYSVEEAEHGGSVTELYWIRTDCCPHCGAKMDGGDPND